MAEQAVATVIVDWQNKTVQVNKPAIAGVSLTQNASTGAATEFIEAGYGLKNERKTTVAITGTITP